VKQVIYRYLDCGILYNGFARVKCKDCGHEYLLAFSCKRRHFCPSCHQKRVVEFGEWLCEEILKAVPHRHFTFSLPKILRRYFLYDRKLLSELSRCAWDSLEVFLLSFPPKQETAPGAVIAIQTFGDFLLLRKGKITEEVVKLIMSWRHSGFIRLWRVQRPLRPQDSTR